MSNGLMKIGGIGAIIWIVGIVIALFSSFAGTSAPMVTITAILIECVAVILVALGAFGLWRKHKSVLGLFAGIFGLAAGMIWLLFGILSYSTTDDMTGFLGVLSALLLVVFLLLLGLDFLVLQSQLDHVSAIPAGVLILIGGSVALFELPLFATLGSILFGLSSTLGGTSTGSALAAIGTLLGSTIAANSVLIPAAMVALVAFFKGN